MKTKTLIFISPHDPQNILNWSGILYFLYNSLQRNNLGIQIQSISGGLSGRVASALAKVLWRFGFRTDIRSTTLFGILMGIELTVRTMFLKDAVIVAVVASNDIAYLRTTKKIIYISDGTFDEFVKMYSNSPTLLPDFNKAFPNWVKLQCEKNQARALAKAHYSIFSSKWASDSARLHYGVPSDRIFELPFGPNISDDLINQNYSRKTISLATEVHFVFVSADWKRKNGDMVLEVCRQLIKAGVKTRLIAIGATAEYAKSLEFVEDWGFLRKSDPGQLVRLCKAYREAHFLLLPSIVDYSPVVFTEAQAFGVPPISCDVGGIGSVIRHKDTGLLLAPDAQAEKYVEAILPYIADSKLYDGLSQRCRDWYLQKANWKSWSDLIMQLGNN